MTKTRAKQIATQLEKFADEIGKLVTQEEEAESGRFDIGELNYAVSSAWHAASSLLKSIR